VIRTLLQGEVIASMLQMNAIEFFGFIIARDYLGNMLTCAAER
jgi:hypothetical protein